jgi:hypothetical protein
MRCALLPILFTACAPSIASLSAARNYDELVCRMATESDVVAAGEALVAATEPRVRINAYVLEGEARVADSVFVAVEARSGGLKETSETIEVSIEPAVDVMDDRLASTGLYALTGEKRLEAHTVEVSTSTLNAENAKWALVTFGLSILAGKQVFDTRTREETIVPTDAERAAQAPKAAQIAAFLVARVPNATWFAVKRTDVDAATLELRLRVVTRSDRRCTGEIALVAPLAIVPGAFTGDFRGVRDWRTLDADRDSTRVHRGK